MTVVGRGALHGMDVLPLPLGLPAGAALGLPLPGRAAAARGCLAPAVPSTSALAELHPGSTCGGGGALSAAMAGSGGGGGMAARRPSPPGGHKGTATLPGAVHHAAGLGASPLPVVATSVPVVPRGHQEAASKPSSGSCGGSSCGDREAVAGQKLPSATAACSQLAWGHHGGSGGVPAASGAVVQPTAAAQAVVSQCNSCVEETGHVGECAVGAAGADEMEAEVDSAEPQVSGASNTVPSMEASTAQQEQRQRTQRAQQMQH